jgi:predicted transcriptional regulator
MTADTQGNAVIVWADAPTATTSKLFMLTFNSTNSTSTQILSVKDWLILWPSVAVDNTDTIHLTWTEYSPHTNQALVEYGTVLKHHFSLSETLASYNSVSAFPPKARIDFDNSSEHIQIAWGETQSIEYPNSTVDYAKLVTNGTVLTRLQVAKFKSTLRDVAITASRGNDGAFVLWQTDSSNDSVFVSQISPTGQLRYLEELNTPTPQLKYLAFSTDSQDNLYVVGYQPALSAPPPQPPPLITSITYIRINVDGDIVESWNEMIREPVISVGVSSDGNIYTVSPEGLVQVVTPDNYYDNGWVTVFAFASCLGALGAFSTEEARYRVIAFCSRSKSNDPSQQCNGVVSVLAKKPGLKLRDFKHLSNANPANMRLLVRMEKSGVLGSFRDGLSRRFYVKTRTAASVDPLATRVLLWIVEHPGIWEAQLSKDLGLSQQLVHYHLKKLREDGLISATVGSDGSRKLYRFANAR